MKARGFNPEKFESYQLKKIERQETKTAEINWIEKLRLPLEKLSEWLRKKGLPVDKECRIDLEEFKKEKFFSPSQIEKDKKLVQQIENKFQSLDQTLKKEILFQKKTGELLEIAKTIAFNAIWFPGKLITVRTSKYDDYFNKVDQLILIPQISKLLKEKKSDSEVIACVDLTESKDKKLKFSDENTRLKIIENLFKGAKIEYGIYFEKDKIIKSSLKRVPYFIVSLPPGKVLNLAEAIFSPESKEFQKILKELKEEILENIKNQAQRTSKECIMLASKLERSNPEEAVVYKSMSEKYQMVKTIFENLEK